MENRNQPVNWKRNTALEAPSTEVKAPPSRTIRLENWDVISHPRKTIRCLFGQVFGDPRFPDGHLVTTSTLVDLRDDEAVTKSGTVYRLGKRVERAYSIASPALLV
jgi:hypothetical protein